MAHTVIDEPKALLQVVRQEIELELARVLPKEIVVLPILHGVDRALRRVGLEKRAVHIPDMLADPECIVSEPYKEEGMRTNLAVPLLKDNELVGAIAMHRR
jgi:GAF domain-containing protein